MNYCTDRPNVTWCKLNGTHCLTLQRPVSWKEEKNSSALILHFEAVVPSDNGSYRCSANVQPEKIESHWVTIYVLGKFSCDVFSILVSGKGGSRFSSDKVRDWIKTMTSLLFLSR